MSEVKSQMTSYYLYSAVLWTRTLLALVKISAIGNRVPFGTKQNKSVYSFKTAVVEMVFNSFDMNNVTMLK